MAAFPMGQRTRQARFAGRDRLRAHAVDRHRLQRAGDCPDRTASAGKTRKDHRTAQAPAVAAAWDLLEAGGRQRHSFDGVAAISARPSSSLMMICWSLTVMTLASRRRPSCRLTFSREILR